MADADAAQERTIKSEALRTPRLLSPPITRTPPTDEVVRTHGEAEEFDDEKLDPVDADALHRALEDADHRTRQREHTPGKSPTRKRPRIYGDRYLPSAPDVERS